MIKYEAKSVDCEKHKSQQWLLDKRANVSCFTLRD